MPHALSHGARIYWRTDGDPSLPALVLGNSLGTDFSLWDSILPRLLRHFYVLRYDMRGHGASDAPAGDYTLDLLTDDLEAVIAAAGLTKLHFCGVSLGGMVGMNYAARQPAALERLVLSNTTARFPDPTLWSTRIDTVRSQGIAAIAEGGLARFFTPGFIATGNIAVQRVRNTLLGIDAEGYAGCCAAIRDMDLFPILNRIQAPTLVVTGQYDVSTPVAAGQALADAIHGSLLITLEAAHIPSVETPVAFTDGLIAFLAPELAQADRFEAGLARRKQILGEAHVERSLANATPFTLRHQELITRYAWGEVWTSSRIEDINRRLIVLAITAATARWEEFELHVEAALRVGVEPELLQDLLVQVAIYAGVPAANTGVKAAGERIARHIAERRAQAS